VPESPTLNYDGQKIRRLRKQRGLTLVQLGELTGRHPAALRNVEKNLKNASRAMLTGIAHALEVSLEEIAEVDSESRKAS
jgi:transcriptional regulator with XRE-family HTH domain